MFIDTQKFLPSPKTSLVKIKSSKGTKVSSLSLLKDIEIKVISIDSFLKKSLVVKKDQVKKEKTITEKQKFRNAEKELEKKVKVKKVSGINLPKPRLGIFDWIKNFATNVLLGFVLVRVIDYLPKLLKLVPLINNAMDFIIDWGGKLLEGLVNFIDFGYKAVDATRGFVSGIFGEDGVKKFDEFSTKFRDVVNYSLIAAMLIGDLGDDIMGGGGGGGVANAASDVAGDIVHERIKEQLAQRAGHGVVSEAVGGAAVGPLAAAGIVAGAGLLASALGEGMFQLKKLSKGTLAWIEKNPLLNNPLGKMVLGPLKVGLWVLNGIGSLFDIIGAPFRYAIELIRFVMMKMSGDTKGLDEQAKNLGKFDARVRDGLREQLAAFGAPLLRMIGQGDAAKSLETEGSWGSLYGDKAVKDMYGHSEGGFAGGIPANRRIKKAKTTRRLKIAPTPLTPGRSVGGSTKDAKTNKTKIEIFYPKDTDVKEVKPYEFVEKSYRSSSKTSFIGSLFGLAIKTIFGDKPSVGDYQNISSGINSWINVIIDKVKMGYRAFAGGGLALSETEEQDLRRWLNIVIQNSVNPRVNEILKELARQLLLKSINPSGASKEKGKGTSGAGGQTDPNAQFQGKADFVIGDSIAHGFAGRSGNGSDADDSKVGRKPIEVLAILKSKGEVLKGKLIDLSTGIANETSDWAIVEEQLKYLQSMGARVRLLGVGKQWDEKVGGNQVNTKLQQLASQYGAYFYGGHNASGDAKLGVHGSTKDYEELKHRLASTAVSGTTTGGNLIEVGKSLLQQGFTVGENKYFKNNAWAGGPPNTGMGFDPSGSQGASGHANDADHRVHSLDVTWHRGASQGPEEVSKLTTLFKDLYSKKDALGLTDLIYDKYGYWFKGRNFTPGVYGGHQDHLHIRFQGAAFGGQYITGFKPKIIKTHKGEYIIDKDSVDAFGLPFIYLINKIENQQQLKGNIDKLMKMLDYEYEGSQTYIVEEEDEYYGQPTATYIGLGNMSAPSNEDDSWHFDSLNAQ